MIRTCYDSLLPLLPTHSAPSYFDPTTIARHLGDNWVLKSSNLRKLLRNLEHYFHEDLHKDTDFRDIDQNKIAKEADYSQIASLVELVAAAAVTCPEKGEYVRRIMQLSPENQVAMKGILESSLQRLSDYEDDDEAHASGEENELVFGGAHADESTEHEDDPQHMGGTKLFGSHDANDLEQQLEDARREIAALKSQASVFAEDNENAQKKLRALVEDLQDRLLKRQNDLIQVEEDLQKATSELDDIKSKMMRMEEEKAQLADDLDVANAKAQQLHKAEATVVAYKKKLDSVGVMNQQMTELEDQASSYLRQIMELENEVKKSNALQKTVNELQDQIAKLDKERSQMESSHRTSATEIADFKSQLSAAESAKKMYEEELRELRAQQEHGAGADMGSMGEGLASVGPAQTKEQRERVMRLEIENKKLQEELEKLKISTESTSSSATAPIAVAVSAASESGDASSQQEIQRLRSELEAKEKENAKVRGDKDKLEAYTKRTLAKFQDKYLVALQECKSKLKEKQDKIEILEKRSASERSAQKREERLLSSTIYELGLAIMQNKLKSGGPAGDK